MKKDFIDDVQSLLDEGNSQNKVAEILNVYHAKIDRLIRKGLVEVYTAFDEEDEKSTYQTFDWLWEEDYLEKMCDIAFDEFSVNLNEVLMENYIGVGKFVRGEYGSIFNYLKKKRKTPLLEYFHKRCLTCERYHSIKSFSRKKGNLFGINTQCNSCQSNRLKEYYHANEVYRERTKDASKVWVANNKERARLITKRAYHKRLAKKRRLPDDMTLEQTRMTLNQFEDCCALTGDINTHFDHVIPLAIGHGGTTFGNMIPLRADLNLSKNSHNFFEWFEANRRRFELSQERFDNLIAWLASANAMTVEEYKDYVYWCHANPRTIDELEAQ